MVFADIKTEPVNVPGSDILPPLSEVPPETEKNITLVAKRIKKYGYSPPEAFVPFYKVPPPAPQPPPQEKKPLVVDIEATGLNPTDSRLIAIGYYDPMDLTAQPSVILMENEETMLKEFMRMYVAGGYDQIIGYNLKYDFRYLFVKCCYYRLPVKEFFTSELKDIMQIYAQVKEQFVFGSNQNLKLEELASHLLGMNKTITYKELFKFYKKKEYQPIIEYSRNDVQMTFLLWALEEVITNQPYSDGLTSTEQTSVKQPSKEPTEFVTVRCPIDLSEHKVPAGQETFTCPVDGSQLPIKDNLVK